MDVNNPKPLAVPSNLFNVMPGTTPITSAAPQVLMPGSGKPEMSRAFIVCVCIPYDQCHGGSLKV